MSLLLTAVLALGISPGIPMPNSTILLISEPNRIFLGDPGPGWSPKGEEQTPYKHSFYYQATDKDSSLSMLLVEADCSQRGRWRIRASSNISLQQDGSLVQGGQNIVRRDSDWIEEDTSEEPATVLELLSSDIWSNTCRGETLLGTKGQMSPWAAAMVWHISRQEIKKPEISLPTLEKPSINKPDIQDLGDTQH